jgi:DNA adenine methylase
MPSHLFTVDIHIARFSRLAILESVNLASIPNTVQPKRSDRPALRPGLKPPLKWAGGKRWQLRHLEAIWSVHAHRRLVEPFCGGLGVVLGLQPEQALLNDINPHLINFYGWLKRGLPSATVEMVNDERAYYIHRDRFNELIRCGRVDTSEAAILFYYLNRTGFNGLCRFNQDGLFNVPFGSHRQINYLAAFGPYRRQFRDWQFALVDFEDLPLGRTDFVYADPPYDVPFTQYSKQGFSWEDQVRCATWLARHPGPVVLSNQATTRIVRLYRNLGFQLRFLRAPRLISCNGDRTPAREVLALKNH